MVKPKQNKGARRNEIDLNGDDGWVLVKKQKVIILIPHLPDTKKTTSPNSRPSPRIAVINQSHVPSEPLPEMASAGEIEKSTSFVPKKDIQLARKTPTRKIVRLSKTPAPVSRMGIKSLSQLDRSNLLNQRLRAENLERKLQRAGGLTRWLKSLGLEQFVTILQGKCVNKFQLVNLTMNKLKDMGAHAVGPRRKLMHAIDCVCQPTVNISPGIKTNLAYYN